MDEAAIQAKLKENVPKPEFRENEQYKPEPETPEIDTSHNNLPLDNMLLKQQMADFLDIPVTARNYPETTEAVDMIVDWAYEQTGSREFADMLRVINRQEGIMGSRRSGDRLFRLYKYVKINKQMQALTEQEKSLYG